MLISSLTKTYNKTFIINFLFNALIFSFIAGSLILNINVILIIIFSLIFYNKELYNLKFDLIDKVIIFFFVYVLFCGVINNVIFLKKGITNDFTIIIKSILYLRFLILYFIIRFLFEKNIINIKIFFLSSFVAVTFVCFDILIQLIFGYDLFGYKAIERRLSGPFGDELIAGAFIQRFSLIFLFFLPIFFKFNKKRNLFIIVFFLTLFLIFFLVLAGNRVPMVLFILTVLSIIIFEKKLRKYFLAFILLTASVIFIAMSVNKEIYYHFHSFQIKIKQIFLITSNENILTEDEERNEYKDMMFYTFEFNGKKYKMTNSYLKEFKTGYVTWKNNKFFGGGLKSFSVICPEAKINNCGPHPHNYFLEILASLGLIGFFIIFFLCFYIFFSILIKKYFLNSNINNFHLITPFLFLFFAEIFPIKSSGSFFTTNNATYFFLILSFLVSLSKIKE